MARCSPQILAWPRAQADACTCARQRTPASSANSCWSMVPLLSLSISLKTFCSSVTFNGCALLGSLPAHHATPELHSRVFRAFVSSCLRVDQIW